MRRGFQLILVLSLLSTLALACTGSGSPTLPLTSRPGEAIPTPNQQLLLGLYDISIDPSGTVEIIPLREASFQVNVVKFLQPPAGNPANLKVKLNMTGSDPAKGIFDMDITITHPFPGTNLRGFDVRGIVIGKGTQLSQFDYDVQFPKVSELRLLNADGYTRWWNPMEFLTPGLFGYTPGVMESGLPKSTVNAYKYFCDGLGKSDPFAVDMATRGTFSTDDGSGGPNTLSREYKIQFPMSGGKPKVQFRYAICASNMSPTPGSTPPAPVADYPISANCPEAYNISVSIDPSSTAYYISTQAGGDLILNIEISDWQASINPMGVLGEISKAMVESPTMWTGALDLMALGTASPGSNETSETWKLLIKNVKPTSDMQDIFISVLSANPTSYAPPGPGGIMYPSGAKLAAYNMTTIRIPGNSAPQVGEISGPGKYSPGAQLEYTLSSMYDLQDGPNLTVMWDFDNDGVFDDDEDGSATNKKGKFTFTGSGTQYVQCRVTDTALAYTDSNILQIEPLSIPYIDPMDTSTQSLWSVQNGLFGYHNATTQWNIQTDHWATSQMANGFYQSDMDTALISPEIPIGTKDTATLTISNRFQIDTYGDYGQIYYRVNGGGWNQLGSYFYGQNPSYPSYDDPSITISGLNEGDLLQIAFDFQSDYYYELKGWDITNFMLIDNEPPEVQGIYGPSSVGTLGPWSYSTVATDIDGIASYMWSLEAKDVTPVYDDPGDGMGGLDVVFPADGSYELWVKVTDAGDPPLSGFFGPYDVSVFSTNPDAFFKEPFDTDTGDWTYTGGTADGSYQDFWHIDTVVGQLSNLGPDGCYAEHTSLPTAKTASVSITFPSSSVETRLKIIHTLWVESGGSSQPYDGQWVTIDGNLIEPSYGFLYENNDGMWSQGYFVGLTDGLTTSTFVLGNTYNDGLEHTLTFHSFSSDTATNCEPLTGWQIDYLELWLND
jgi:hypothetical protein